MAQYGLFFRFWIQLAGNIHYLFGFEVHFILESRHFYASRIGSIHVFMYRAHTIISPVALGEYIGQ